LIKNSQQFGKKFQKTVGGIFLTHTVHANWQLAQTATLPRRFFSNFTRKTKFFNRKQIRCHKRPYMQQALCYAHTLIS